MQRSLNQRQAAVYSELFSLVPTRAQRRMLQIIEGAIRNYISLGVENTTYESIAKACKISRPLIQHYFKDKDEVFQMAVKYIRVNYQQYTIQAFRNKNTPQERLAAYVDAAVGWVKAFPAHQRVWNLFYYYCGVDKRLCDLNTELVNIGHDRITALLQEGAEAGVFAADNLKGRAKQIQVLITGSIVTITTETLYADIEEFRAQITEACVRLATTPSPQKSLTQP
jgi:AcrR family transcriptional regulator